MHRVTVIAHEGHVRVRRRIVKGMFLLRVPAFGGMALEACACAYGKMETGGLLRLAEGPRHGIARRKKLNDQFIFDGRADMAINTLHVLGVVYPNPADNSIDPKTR